MKIKKVKWLNHPVLGDSELDFINSSTGVPYDNILLAGENGIGKTTILESLSTFLNLGSFEYFDFIEYIVDTQTIIKIVPPSNFSHAVHGWHTRINQNGTSIEIQRGKSTSPKEIDTDPLDIRHYGCVFSKARADYKTKKITTTTTKEIDIDKYDQDLEDDFTSLKQLIVDIDHEDKEAYAQTNMTMGGNPMSWGAFYPTSKIYRFSYAFDSFFEKIKFNQIENDNGEKVIFFKKNNEKVSIDLLSTGEKQIVFRGTYLLKNSGNLKGAVCMVDEPELSMHPKWQQKIFNYYTSLFKNTTGTQEVQLLFATHSTEVLKSALMDKNNSLVIVLQESNNVVSPKRIDAPSVLPAITSAETNYLAFDVISNDYHIELYGWLQNKNNLSRVKACDDYIKQQAIYNTSLHAKSSSHPNGKITYDTLSTFIRNAIDHPSSAGSFSDEELRKSIELLVELCR